MASPDLYSYEYPDPTQAGSSTWTADSNPHLEPEDQQTNTGPVIHQGFIQDDNYDLGPRHENRPISAARNRRHIQPTQHSRPSDNISNGEGRFDSEEDEEQYLRHRALSDDSLVDEDYEFSDRSADEEVDGAEETEDDSENSNNEEESGHYALEAEVANLKQSFQRPEEEEDINKGLPKHRRGRPGRRGPREAAKLSQETRALLGEANSAFIAGRYEEAEELANDILVKNNEIYAAYMLLSEIQLARDDTTASLVTMITAAHLRPREPALWHTIASRCLQRTGRSRRIWINQAIYCLNQVLRLDNRDFSTRMERAALYHELGQTKKIAREYDFMLKSLPHDLAILRAFGEICLERKEFERGKKYYQAAFEHYKARAPDDESETISWVDINIYSQLIAGIDGCAEAIFQLKSLSRGLLRRGEETYWDDIQEDDCEWDAEDRPRRVEVPGYDPERFHLESYGLGMPLELRMKLGVFRLQQGQQYSMEALSHFSWLDPEDDGSGAKIFEYADLFKEAADALAAAGYPHKALSFYEPIQLIDDYKDLTIYFGMASCYRSVELFNQAEQSYSAVIIRDPSNVGARVQLAEMLEGLGRTEEALRYVNEVIESRREAARQRELEDDASDGDEQVGEGTFIPIAAGAREGAKKQRRPYEPKPGDRRFGPRNRRFREPKDVRLLHMKLQNLQDRVGMGDEEAINEWTETAKSMLAEFGFCKLFFPPERHVRFYGYSAEARRKSWKTTKLDKVDTLAGRLHAALDDTDYDSPDNAIIPEDFDGIPFTSWFDLFLEYATVVTRMGNAEEAYRVINVAQHANVFYHEEDLVFQLNACVLACALEARDEFVICKTTRLFMQSSHYVSEASRLYAALCRICLATTNWFNAGPSQKYILRQIKAIDYHLLEDSERHANHFRERAKPLKRRNEATPDKMDVALIMLYGQMMYAGTSYTYGLNYFFRALALEPQNPMVNLCIGLSYIQQALKRQSENRHQLVMQGIAFLNIYYDIRKKSEQLVERQEAEYNMGRAYHLLGLSHLAEPYYTRVLKIAEERGPSTTHEAYEKVAAYNLRIMLTLAGDGQGAKAVGKKWLVL